MSQEEINKEVAELKEQLDALRSILEEDQRLGWVLRKKPVEWHEMQRRLHQKQVKWLRGKSRKLSWKWKSTFVNPNREKFWEKVKMKT